MTGRDVFKCTDKMLTLLPKHSYAALSQHGAQSVRLTGAGERDDAAIVAFGAGEAEIAHESCKYGRVGENVVAFIRIQSEGVDRDLALEKVAESELY